MKFYKSMTVHTLTYGSEIWTITITTKEKTKIQSTEMKFLRSVTGYTGKDQIRNI
jgi:hypothetical protein